MSNNFFKSLPPLPMPPSVKATEYGLQHGRHVKITALPDTPVGLQASPTARRECTGEIPVIGRLRDERLKATSPQPRKLTAQNLMILEKVYPSEKKLVNYNRNRSGSESSFYSDRATRGMCPVTPEGIRSLPVTSERIAVATSCVGGFNRTINVSITSKPAVVERHARVKRQSRSGGVTAERSSTETAFVPTFQSIKESLRAADVSLPESNTVNRSVAATPERTSSPARPQRTQQPTRPAVSRSCESMPDSQAILYDKLESGDFGAHSPEFPGAFKLMSSGNSLPKRVAVGGACESDSDGFEAIGRSAVLLAAAVLAMN